MVYDNILDEDSKAEITKSTYDSSILDANYLYAKYSNGYQIYVLCYTPEFNTNNEDDMIFLSVESPSMSKDEFEELVNNVQDSHSYTLLFDAFKLPE